MSKIGSFGDIIFEVSPNKTQTFNEFQRSGSSRWNEHGIIGQKPKSEFNGSDLEEINLTMLFKASLGINPSKQLSLLRSMKDSGKAAPFLLGGKPISSNYWVISQMTENNKVIDNKGNVIEAECSLDLKEYVLNKKTTAKKTVKSVKSTSTSSSKKTLGKITIKVKSVNIRSGPGTTYKVIGWAMNKDVLTVYSVKNGWYSLGQGKYITANSAYSTLKKG